MNGRLRIRIRIPQFSDPIFRLAQKWTLANVFKYFKPRKRGLGFHRVHSGQFFVTQWKYADLRVKFFFSISQLCVGGRFFFVMTIVGPKAKLDPEPKIFLRFGHCCGHMAKNGQKVDFTFYTKSRCAPHCPWLLNVFSGGNYFN